MSLFRSLLCVVVVAASCEARAEERKPCCTSQSGLRNPELAPVLVSFAVRIASAFPSMMGGPMPKEDFREQYEYTRAYILVLVRHAPDTEKREKYTKALFLFDQFQVEYEQLIRDPGSVSHPWYMPAAWPRLLQRAYAACRSVCDVASLKPLDVDKRLPVTAGESRLLTIAMIAMTPSEYYPPDQRWVVPFAHLASRVFLTAYIGARLS